MPARTAKSFNELYDELELDEKDFFDFLDHQVDKVESFYTARREEAKRRAHDLRDQLRELAEHRKLYHELYPEGKPEWEARVQRVIPGVTLGPSAHTWATSLQRHLPFRHEPEPDKKEPSSNPPDSRERAALRAAMLADRDHQTYSPERYQKYKTELRKAVLEFYRTLELIKNYRVGLTSRLR
jgi:hypothetical protein